MRVVLTGANGYLGQAILEQSRLSGAGVIGVTRGDADLENPGAVEQLLKVYKPDVLIHCAAEAPKTLEDYGSGERAAANLRMVRHLLYLRGNHRIVFASSMAVHGNSVYGAGKLAAEHFIGERGVSLRLPGLFGKPRRSGLLYNAAQAFLAGRHFDVDPELPLWSPFHVRSAARLCLAALEWEGIVDVAYPGMPTAGEVMALLWNLCGQQGGYTCPASERYAPDLSKLLSLWEPPSLENDLREFVEWIRSGH